MKYFIVGFILIALNMCPTVYAEERVYISSPDIVVINDMTDSGAGMGQMQYSVDNQQTWTPAEQHAVSKNLTLPDINEGEHCIYAKFSDAIDNWTQSIEACAWVDTTPPGGPVTIEGITINVNVNIN